MPIRPPMAEPDLVEHTGFLLAEDEMMKTYLSDITVPTRPGSDGQQQSGRAGSAGPRASARSSIRSSRSTRSPPNLPMSCSTSNHRMEAHRAVSPIGGHRRCRCPPGGWAMQGYSVRNYWPVPPGLPGDVLHARSTSTTATCGARFVTDVFPPRPFWIGCDADNTWRRTEVSRFRFRRPARDDRVGHQAHLPQDVHRLDAGRGSAGAIIEAYRVLRVSSPSWPESRWTSSTATCSTASPTPSTTSQTSNVKTKVSTSTSPMRALKSRTAIVILPPGSENLSSHSFGTHVSPGGATMAITYRRPGVYLEESLLVNPSDVAGTVTVSRASSVSPPKARSTNQRWSSRGATSSLSSVASNPITTPTPVDPNDITSARLRGRRSPANLPASRPHVTYGDGLYTGPAFGHGSTTS